MLILKNKVNRPVDGPLTFAKADAPDEATRQLLRDQLTHIERKLASCSQDLLALALIRFFKGYREIEFWEKQQIVDKLEAYKRVLFGLPQWAVELAIRRAPNLPDPERLPNAGQLRLLVLQDVLKAESDKRDIFEILNAKVLAEPELTPEQRKEIVDRLWFNGARETVAHGGREQTAEEKEAEHLQKVDFVKASQILVTRGLEAHGINDGLPHSIELRRKFAEYAEERARNDEPDPQERGAAHR